jgi:hypothetical protein
MVKERRVPTVMPIMAPDKTTMSASKRYTLYKSFARRPIALRIASSLACEKILALIVALSEKKHRNIAIAIIIPNTI